MTRPPPDDFYTEAGRAGDVREVRLGYEKGDLLPLLVLRDDGGVGDVLLFHIIRGLLQRATIGC